MFSSPRAFAQTLDVHLTTMANREPPRATPAGERVLRPLIERLDAKFAALRGWLDPIVPPTGVSTERVIIFTEYRLTMRRARPTASGTWVFALIAP